MKPSGTRKNVYKALGIAGSSALLLGTVQLLSPSTVGAFWPISRAQANDVPTPILHDSSLNLLEAARNIDPNPEKGGAELALSDGSALMDTTGPDGTLPDATDASSVDTGSADTSSGNTISIYVVKNGDTISQIADRFNVTPNTILWANNLTAKGTIKPGMSLVILPVSGIQHTVAKGETLSSIAASYHSSSAEIATLNGLDADATVTVGSSLIIPTDQTSDSAPAPEKSASTPTKTTMKTTTKATTKSSSVKTRDDLASATPSSGYFENPVPGAILTQGIHDNNAVDLGAPSGTPIHAAAPGTVSLSVADGSWNHGWGSDVVIEDSNGTQTLYAHMSKNTATIGEHVSQGDIIGYVGETGDATGNHLHFEVHGGRNPFGYSCSLMSKCY